jgi:hypothetical protein
MDWGGQWPHSDTAAVVLTDGLILSREESTEIFIAPMKDFSLF